MSLIAIDNLRKSYKHGKSHTEVLKGVDLRIDEGSFVSILGRSGSGKTTLLNVISTLEVFDSGVLMIDGHSINKMNSDQLNTVRNNYIGFVFQEFNLVKDMTVLDNVATPLILQGIKFKQAREKAIVALNKVGLGQYVKMRPTELSGGQQQRVAIARAIANDQRILLCDEPTGALDDFTAKEILELLKELALEKTVIMVTHDEEFAKTYSDRIIMLVDGVIKRDILINKIPKVQKEQQKLKKKSIGFVNLFTYSFVSMDVDNKKMGKTFKTFSIALAIFMIVSIINHHLDVFTATFFSSVVETEAVDQVVLLDFLYQFVQENITVLINVVLYTLLIFCVVSYLFVFTINILNKKREIAVLKAFGASYMTIAILFALRPIRFTLQIFKNSIIYATISLLLLNGILDMKMLISADFFNFFVHFFQVAYGFVLSFVLNTGNDYVAFYLDYKTILVLFLVILGLFMVGSLLPAYTISRSNTIRMLASE